MARSDKTFRLAEGLKRDQKHQAAQAVNRKVRVEN